MKICKKCNKIYENSYKFCPECGQKLGDHVIKVEFEIKDGKLVGIKRTKGMVTPALNGDYSFDSDDNEKVYFSGSHEFLVFGEWKRSSVISIPKSVSEIPSSFCESHLFSYLLEIPSSVKIASGPHFVWSSFYNVSLSCECKSFFYRCRIYNELKIEPIIETVGPFLLSSCNVNKLVLPENIKSIKPNAFFRSTIEELVVPKGITYWAYGGYSFYDEKVKDVKIRNLRYLGSKRELKKVLESSLKERDKKIKCITVDENQIIHCIDGDVKCRNIDDLTFEVVII